MPLRLLTVLACVALVSALAIFSAMDAAANPAVERGRYLAITGDCVVCHTRTEPGSPQFAGGYPLHAAPGTVYSSNITPDRETGIGAWTNDQFYRALHEGISADGHHLYPAFPYAYFARLSRTDTDALFAYLKTVKPVHYRPPANRLIFPANIRGLMAFWNALYLSGGPFKPDASQTAQWNRGKEIVTGIGHCGACHSPKNFLFADSSGAALQGNLIDGWYAPDLTGAKPGGLGAWTATDIALYLKRGQNSFTRVTGAMRDVVEQSTGRMTDADRAAIAAYLKSLPAEPTPAPSRAPDSASLQQGQAVYVARCTVCHAVGGKGSAGYPALAGNSIVRARNPDTVLRVLLQGSQSAQVPGEKIGYSMPAFPVLSDAELADVATYIRSAWGNRAGPVSAHDAGAFRKLISAGP